MTFDPMRTFDAETAYAGDYRFIPGIRRAFRRRAAVTNDAAIWVRRVMLSHPDYPAAAERLGVNSTDEIWEVYKENLDDADPMPNDRILFDQQQVEPLLIVGRVAQSHYNRWNVTTTREV
jgi:hypothetical protein